MHEMPTAGNMLPDNEDPKAYGKAQEVATKGTQVQV